MAKGLGARVVPGRGRRSIPEGGAYVQVEAHAAGHAPAMATTITGTPHGHGMRTIIAHHGHDHHDHEHCDHPDHRSRRTITRTTTPIDGHGHEHGHGAAAEPDSALLPLMLWLSPAFPVGSFAYSHGLEWAVEAGDISDARSLGGWLVDLLTFGAPRADAILFAGAFRAAEAGDRQALDRGERARRRARALGRAAARDDRAGFGLRRRRARRVGLRAACGALADEARVAYPVAVAAAAAGHGLPLEASLQAFVLALLANAVSAVVRLGPIGQTAGRRFSPRSCRASARSPARRRARRSPISAAAPSAPTSPPCATRRNIRGCSGRDRQLTLTPGISDKQKS